MPVFQPFRGLRYRGLTDVSAVAAPPYDVIQDAQRDELEARDPHNAVRLILPRAGEEGDRYDTAARLLDRWRAEHVLALDDRPAFYGSRMSFVDPHGARRVTHGIVGALGLPERGPGTGDILPHERTIPRHRTDRLSLLRATRANLDPIWGLSGAEGLASLVGEPGPATQVAVDADDVRHESWPITDPARVAAIRAAVASTPLVLADGHHRFETACAYRAERPDDRGATAIMALVVELTESELWVAPIHRLVQGAPHLRAHLARAFALVPVGPNRPETVRELEARMAQAAAMGLIDRDGCAVLTPRPETVATALDAEAPEVRAVDAALFEVAVVPRLDGARLDYRDDAQSVAEVVRRGGADAAFLLRPVTVAQIRSASFAGVRMPQKTTFFAPKPRTGLVFRSLDD